MSEFSACGDQPKSPPRRATVPFPGTPDRLARLDLRVGMIIHVEPHVTDPDKYYFEYINAGDRVSQLFVTGLNQLVSPDELEEQRVVLLYAALPFWWNCMDSRLFRILTVRAPGRVEFLEPPLGAIPGERVTVDGFINDVPLLKPTYPFYSDEDELWDLVAPYFFVNDERIALFKGLPMVVKGKGFVKTKSMSGFVQ